MRPFIRLFAFAATFLVIFSGCSEVSTNKKNGETLAPRFAALTSEQTGLNFDNVLKQTDAFNVFYYMYYFNGGGLAAGDFNQDGFIDLYFTSNMGPNKLFLNRGEFNFEDVTSVAGVAGVEGWTSGASVVDINNDGLLDIYVSQVGDYLEVKGKNQLYICTGISDTGIPTFEDRAADYGLDLVGFGTQGTFFDYDLDGDLDLFQLNHSLHQNGTFGKRDVFNKKRHPLAGDRLLRNDGSTFTDVTELANINSTSIGYGLGVATGDLNNDGFPDLYVGNDFHENDYLYLNQGDGTFREVLTEQIDYTSRFSMGVDIADINNDGLSEIISLDMLPEDPYILKSSLGEDGYDVFQFKLGHGYHPQFARNNLQLNNGNGTYTEIGRYAGIYATDWSWAPLFFDQDHDGFKDLFITNGIPRRMNDIDYVNFKTNDDLKYKEQFNDIKEEDLSYIDKMPEIKLKNKFYRNQGNLTFSDLTEAMTDNPVSYSNSGIYADLDNDGDLDLVVNNIDDHPTVYQNLHSDNQPAQGSFLNLNLKGTEKNINAIGARVIVYAGENELSSEHFPTRGYQSSALTTLHLGVGKFSQSIDSIVLIWPDRTYQLLPTSVLNKATEISWSSGLPAWVFPNKKQLNRTFKDIASEVGVTHLHHENPFVDFNREKLIPRKASAEGPAVAVGDVNGDGLEDFFIGSSKRNRSSLFLQTPSGQFTLSAQPAIVTDSVFEDVDAVFADVENDGDLDLIVAAGGNEYRFEQEPRLQRAYINDGKGNFTRKDLFPGAFLTASCVLAGDVNNDGLVDFFFGARVVPWAYGETPKSMLFLNLGEGKFSSEPQAINEQSGGKMANDQSAAMLAEAGMITDGQMIDLDNDGDLDIVLAIEWQPIKVFLNQSGKFTPFDVGPQSGWWNSVEVADFDQDGDLDILAGNFGENSKLKPTEAEPVTMYVNDFDNNDQIESVLSYYVAGQNIPLATYAEMTKQIVSLKKRFLYAKDFAAASVDELFDAKKLKEAKRYTANYFSSVLYLNEGNGKFIAHKLPPAAQLAPIKGSSFVNSDNEGRTYVLLGGNSTQENIELGWHIGSQGQLLTIYANGEMSVENLDNSLLGGETSAITSIKIGAKRSYLAVRINRKTVILQ